MKKYLSYFLSLCLVLQSTVFPQLAFAVTPVDQYITMGATCVGEDGTIAHPYCDCQDWENQNTNLVVADQSLTVHSTGTGAAQCTISGWTTNITHPIVIDGLVIASSNYSGGVLIVNDPYVTIKNANIQKTGVFVGVATLNIGATAAINFTMERSKISNATSVIRDTENQCIFIGAGAGENVTFRNNFIYDCRQGGLVVDLAGTSTYVLDNNTMVGNGGTAFTLQVSVSPVGTTINQYNNIVTGSATADYATSVGVATHNHATNISSDTTSPDASFRSKTITYVNAATKDFHLDPAETDAIDLGTTIGSFSNDYDNDTRPGGSAWEIGADEIVVATPTPTPTPTPGASSCTKSQRCSLCKKGQCG